MAQFNRATSTEAWPSRQRSGSAHLGLLAHKQRRQGKISPWRGGGGGQLLDSGGGRRCGG
jgi:hypothetical protein